MKTTSKNKDVLKNEDDLKKRKTTSKMKTTSRNYGDIGFSLKIMFQAPKGSQQKKL